MAKLKTKTEPSCARTVAGKTCGHRYDEHSRADGDRFRWHGPCTVAGCECPCFISPEEAEELCPSCKKGDCYGHQHDFLKDWRVVPCTCSDPYKQHGKMRPKKT